METKILTREEQLDIYIKVAIENLKDKKESKLGLQLINWVEEREKLRFIEYCEFLLSNRLHPEYSIRDLRREVEREIAELKDCIKSEEGRHGIPPQA